MLPADRKNTETENTVGQWHHKARRPQRKPARRKAPACLPLNGTYKRRRNNDQKHATSGHISSPPLCQLVNYCCCVDTLRHMARHPSSSKRAIGSSPFVHPCRWVYTPNASQQFHLGTSSKHIRPPDRGRRGLPGPLSSHPPSNPVEIPAAPRTGQGVLVRQPLRRRQPNPRRAPASAPVPRSLNPCAYLFAVVGGVGDGGAQWGGGKARGRLCRAHLPFFPAFGAGGARTAAGKRSAPHSTNVSPLHM